MAATAKEKPPKETKWPIVIKPEHKGKAAKLQADLQDKLRSQAEHVRNTVYKGNPSSAGR